jgi:hypothetical protein
LAILNYFILGYFRLCEVNVGYFWLLKFISPYVIIGYCSLYHHRLFLVIILVATGLVTIVGYYIVGYWFNDYCWLLYYWLLMVIL